MATRVDLSVFMVIMVRNTITGRGTCTPYVQPRRHFNMVWLGSRAVTRYCRSGKLGWASIDWLTEVVTSTVAHSSCLACRADRRPVVLRHLPCGRARHVEGGRVGTPRLVGQTYSTPMAHSTVL